MRATASDICSFTVANSALAGAMDSWMIVLSSSVAGRLVFSNVCRTEVSKIEHELCFRVPYSPKTYCTEELDPFFMAFYSFSRGNVGGTQLSPERPETLLERVVNVTVVVGILLGNRIFSRNFCTTDM